MSYNLQVNSDVFEIMALVSLPILPVCLSGISFESWYNHACNGGFCCGSGRVYKNSLKKHIEERPGNS